MNRWILAAVVAAALHDVSAGTMEAGAREPTLPDPMQPLIAPAPPASADPGQLPEQFELTAIKSDGRHPQAIINGQLVGEGARIGTARVRKIGHRQVDITTERGVATLRLNTYEIKHEVDPRHPTP